MTPVQILIVDDEPMIGDVLRSYFEQAGYKVETAETGREAMEQFQKWNPDLIILDLMLPDMKGEEICERIRQESDVPIIMLTAKTAEADRIHGLVIGADDYVVKPFSPREVVVRAQAILRRIKKLKEEECYSYQGGELFIDLPKQEVKVKGELVSLTPIEFKLLSGMAQYPGRVYRRAELLEKVQGDLYESYERSIDVHVKNLRKKIETDPKEPVYILTVFGMGYKFGGQPDV
ncbi:response regulator transcription factor [Rubeoparvulum massiliense]|uniref:response regulator transcription factor n=1 Tax=Rubeoparvulum massiliense TaxID=1631346 RepID=UPI00065E0D58|nr:response regulator transcription factor [Rubeoparvulum massiliense]